MVEDLAGLGKVAEVISNAVGKAIGSLMEPWQIRRVGYAKADAEVYAIEKKAEAAYPNLVSINRAISKHEPHNGLLHRKSIDKLI